MYLKASYVSIGDPAYPCVRRNIGRDCAGVSLCSHNRSFPIVTAEIECLSHFAARSLSVGYHSLAVRELRLIRSATTKKNC